MPYITSENIRDISVRTVEMFLNDKVPLSQGLAKQASAMELNSEQIQRAVEATNSIAYLKVLSLSDDRTVEFPLCKFAEVMHTIVTPTQPYSLTELLSTPKEVSAMFKQASVEGYVSPDLESAEKNLIFVKMAAMNFRQLQNLLDREITLVPEILKSAKIVKDDPRGLEKLATVCSGKSYDYITTLVYGSKQEYNDTGIFKEAELKEVQVVAELLKEATQLARDISEKQDMHTRSEVVKDLMKQSSILGAIGSGIGKGVGKLFGSGIKRVGSELGQAGQNMGVSSRNFATGIKNDLTGSNTPMKAKPFKRSLGMSVAIGGGVMGMEATTYNPGKDAIAGRSKNIWTNLQKEST